MNTRVLRYAALGAAGLVAAAAATYFVLRPAPARNLIEANGQVRGTEITLSARIPGIAEVVAVREGELVMRGDLVAQIAARVAAGTSSHEVHRASEALARAAAEVAAAEAQAEQDQRTYERFEKLVAEGFVSRNYFDELSARRRGSDARLTAARQAVEEARAARERALAASGEVEIRDAVRALTRRFGKRTALDAITLQIAAGELFGVVGADGAGKTTLLQSMCAILDPSAGAVNVMGLDSVRDAPRIHLELGYVAQAYSLYGDLTAAENLEFFAAIRSVRAAAFAARRAELLRFSGLAPFLERRAKALSGGMQKKLAVACSLMHEPQILVLDEPTLGVGPISRRELWRMLREFHARGRTIVVATSYRASGKCLTLDSLTPNPSPRGRGERPAPNGLSPI